MCGTANAHLSVVFLQQLVTLCMSHLIIVAVAKWLR